MFNLLSNNQSNSDKVNMLRLRAKYVLFTIFVMKHFLTWTVFMLQAPGNICSNGACIYNPKGHWLGTYKHILGEQREID